MILFKSYADESVGCLIMKKDLEHKLPQIHRRHFVSLNTNKTLSAPRGCNIERECLCTLSLALSCVRGTNKILPVVTAHNFTPQGISWMMCWCVMLQLSLELFCCSSITEGREWNLYTATTTGSLHSECMYFSPPPSWHSTSIRCF